MPAKNWFFQCEQAVLRNYDSRHPTSRETIPEEKGEKTYYSTLRQNRNIHDDRWITNVESPSPQWTE